CAFCPRQLRRRRPSFEWLSQIGNQLFTLPKVFARLLLLEQPLRVSSEFGQPHPFFKVTTDRPPDAARFRVDSNPAQRATQPTSQVTSNPAKPKSGWQIYLNCRSPFCGK